MFKSLAAGVFKDKKEYLVKLRQAGSKIKEVIDNPEFQAALKGNNFEGAKAILLNTIMQSEIEDDSKKKILQNVEAIESRGGSVADLQKYVWNSYLAYIDPSLMVSKYAALLELADQLDKKGLFAEANIIDKMLFGEE